MLTHPSLSAALAYQTRSKRLLAAAIVANTVHSGVFLTLVFIDPVAYIPASRLSQSAVIQPLLILGYAILYLKLRHIVAEEQRRSLAWFFAFVCQYLVIQSVNQSILS